MSTRAFHMFVVFYTTAVLLCAIFAAWVGMVIVVNATQQLP